MDKRTGQFLAKQLYPDLKTWLPSLCRGLSRPPKRGVVQAFASPSDLLDALRTGAVRDGDPVALEAKRSPFGPFLRSHFVGSVAGPTAGVGLGPPVTDDDPSFATTARTTFHLKPVGLYPPVDACTAQVCLYPSDATACGFAGPFPGLDRVVEHVPCLMSTRLAPSEGGACTVTGAARLADPRLLVDSGVPLEDHEEFRRAGPVWFLDATGDAADCVPLGDAPPTELWGGLYAQGHLETASGRLPVDAVVSSVRDAARGAGFETEVTRSQAGRQDVLISGRGFRSTVDTRAPLFSVHMDADVATGSETARRRFDQITEDLLSAIASACSASSVELVNPMDLDFSYTDSSGAFSVLKSRGSEHVGDPLAVAVRDWHRTRGV